MKKIIFYISIIVLVVTLQFFYTNSVFASNKYDSSGYKNNAIYPKSVKIKKDFNNIYELAKEYKLNIEYYPSNTTEKDIEWSSSDTSILTIDDNGKLIAKKRGTVKVTAKTVNGKTDSITISVIGANSTTGELKAIKSISITNAPKNMYLGENFKLNVQTSPVYDVLKKFTYKSSNEKVLKVNKDGLVEAVGKGKATITVKTNNNKTAKAIIEVLDYKINLSTNKITGNEGETKEIIATVEGNNINSNSVKWLVSSTNNASVKSVSSSRNTFKANINLKKYGKTTVKFKIGSEYKDVKVVINKLGSDTSIDCPIINYDTSDSNNIKIDISPDSSITKYDIYVSGNKWTGKNAKWINYVSNVNGKKTYSIPYSNAQARLTVYNKNGKTRYCYTAPFDLDRSKKSNTNISYTNKKICPNITETKLNKVSNANIYSMHYYGSSDILKTGVESAYIKIKTDAKRKYQYTWLEKEGKYYVSNICDNNGCGIWNLKQTFDQHKNMEYVLKPSKQTYYDKQGMVLITDTSGNVQTCYTNIYSSLYYSNKITINNTNIYFENNYNYNQKEMIKVINSLPEYYLPASNIFFLTLDTYSKKFGSDSCGVTFNEYLNVYLTSGNYCPFDFAKVAIIHELGHTTDSISKKINGIRISDYPDINENKIKYKNTQYLRDYAYTNNSEFWAELFAAHYINNYFINNIYKNNYKLDNNLNNLFNKYDKYINKTYNNNKSKWTEIKKKYQ